MQRAETSSFQLIYIVWLSLARINQNRLFAVLSTTKFKSQKFVSLTDNGNETATAVQRPQHARQNRKRSPKTLLTHSPALVTTSSSARHASSRTLLLVLGTSFAHTQEFIDPSVSRMIRTFLTSATLQTVMLVLGPERLVCKNRMGPERPTIRGGCSFANRLANREEAVDGNDEMDLNCSRISQQSAERRVGGKVEGPILRKIRVKVR